jgi:hypothetical protein
MLQLHTCCNWGLQDNRPWHCLFAVNAAFKGMVPLEGMHCA